MKLIDTLAELIRINSVNPSYAAGNSEKQIQQFVRSLFVQNGIDVEEQEALPGRYNVIAKLPGRNVSRKLVLEAHCDTAGVDGMAIPPFDPRVVGGRMYGRGSCDTKAGLAAMIQALVDSKSSRTAPPCQIWMASLVDEEDTCQGVRKFCENLQASAAVIAEPTELRMVTTSKGVLRWRITAEGKAAHSSKPHLGSNAIELMAKVVSHLESSNAGLQSVHHPLVGSPTCTVGLIHGGTQVNMVPASCWIEVDRRVNPGENAEQILRSYEELLDDVRRKFPDFKLIMDHPRVQVRAMDTPVDSEIARYTAKALVDVGLDSSPHGVPFGSDGSTLSSAGVPCVVLGAGSIDLAHTAEEYVPLDQVESAFEVYRRLIMTFE
jgi:acetylornithine deacetylase/succinyl-diaminopimelate desuccinylase-like protein